jgi:hypothetical protein
VARLRTDLTPPPRPERACAGLWFGRLLVPKREADHGNLPARRREPCPVDVVPLLAGGQSPRLTELRVDRAFTQVLMLRSRRTDEHLMAAKLLTGGPHNARRRLGRRFAAIGVLPALLLTGSLLLASPAVADLPPTLTSASVDSQNHVTVTWTPPAGATETVERLA